MSEFLQRLHGQTNRALWGALTAFLIFFGVAVLPHIRENQAAYRVAQDADISAESDAYCRRWKFVPSTNDYRSCLEDVAALRASIQTRIANEFAF
jgi:hypothetical protein